MSMVRTKGGKLVPFTTATTLGELREYLHEHGAVLWRFTLARRVFRAELARGDHQRFVGEGATPWTALAEADRRMRKEIRHG